MMNTHSQRLPILLAASLLGLGSCSTPPQEAEAIEPTAVTKELAQEAEILAAAELEAVEGRIVEVEVEVPEEPIIEEVVVVEEEPIIEEFEVVEEAAALPGVKVMGPWVAGDQIDSGRPGVKPIEILAVHANGSGDLCGEGRSATLRYVAMKADGTVIDPGTRPFTFRVGQGRAISGWDVVVAKMRVGDSFTLILPQELAYGPSKGDLKFDMELLSFR